MTGRIESFCAALDRINRLTGQTVRWLALAMVLVQFVIVVLRYAFGVSDIALSESVLYMHAAIIMIGAGYTFLLDDHVRVDIFYGRASERGRDMIDLFGAALFVVPSMLVLSWWTWPFVASSWRILEGPLSVGGIPALFILKSLIPAFCLLLAVQAVSFGLRAALRLGLLGGTHLGDRSQ